MGKMLVFGDSIAYGKWDSEGGWVIRLRNYVDEKYNITKGNNLLICNLGIPGEVAPRLAERFTTELKFRIEPADKNVVLIAIGVNDSCPNNWMTNKQTSEDEFKNAIHKMVEVAKKMNCKVALIGLTPVNPEKSKGLLFTNKEVKKYDDYLSDIAKEKSLLKLELFDKLLKTGFGNLLVDSVHPNDKGHKKMTEAVIQFLNNNSLIEYCAS